MLIYNSNRYFKVFDYYLSHCQLLIRSDKAQDEKENIDIIFFNTSYMQIFNSLYGLKLKLIDKNDLNIFSSLNRYLSNENSNLFELESGNEKFYIAASFVKIFANELSYNVTSLGLVGDGREKEIASST